MSRSTPPRYAPWKHGPAEIIAFPNPPRRAIYVERAYAGATPVEEFWVALATDCDGEIMFRSTTGPRDLVLNALASTRVRRGLPIVIAKGDQIG